MKAKSSDEEYSLPVRRSTIQGQQALNTPTLHSIKCILVVATGMLIFLVIQILLSLPHSNALMRSGAQEHTIQNTAAQEEALLSIYAKHTQNTSFLSLAWSHNPRYQVPALLIHVGKESLGKEFIVDAMFSAGNVHPEEHSLFHMPASETYNNVFPLGDGRPWCGPGAA